MSIIKTMRRQKCLWFARANGGAPDSYGNMTYAEPVEIKCRYVIKDALAVNRRDSAQNIQDSPKQSSESYLYPDRILSPDDVVWLGTLAEWTGAGHPTDGSISPLDVEGSIVVKTFMQLPNLRNTEILYKATL